MNWLLYRFSTSDLRWGKKHMRLDCRILNLWQFYECIQCQVTAICWSLHSAVFSVLKDANNVSVHSQCHWHVKFSRCAKFQKCLKCFGFVVEHRERQGIQLAEACCSSPEGSCWEIWGLSVEKQAGWTETKVVMVALCNRETIYIFMLWFVLPSSSFFFLA